MNTQTVVMVDLDYPLQFYSDMQEFIDEHIKMMAKAFNYEVVKKEVKVSKSGNVHIYLWVQYDGDNEKLLHFLYSLGDDPMHTRLMKVRQMLYSRIISFI